MLRADEAEFAAAVADIDRRLRAEIRARQETRRRIARLTAGDSLALPAEVVAFLDRLRELGVDERIVAVEREGWIPLAAHSPDRVPEWLARKRAQLADAQLLDFYRTLGRALDWAPDDPRLTALADDLAAYLARLTAERGRDYVADVDLAPPLAELMDTLAFEAAPAGAAAHRAAAEAGLDGVDEAGAAGDAPISGVMGTHHVGSYYLRQRTGSRMWRALHRFIIIVYVLSVWHTLLYGTNVWYDGAFRTLVWALQMPIAAMLLLRLLSPARPSERLHLRGPRRARPLP